MADLTTNTIPKATSNTNIQDSSITDDGTIVVVGENFGVAGTTILDNGSITTDGNGNMQVAAFQSNSIVNSGTFNSDSGQVTTDGGGNLTCGGIIVDLIDITSMNGQGGFGVDLNGNIQTNGTITTNGGAANAVIGGTFSCSATSMTVDAVGNIATAGNVTITNENNLAPLVIAGVSTDAGSEVGTLTNSPTAGNPAFWLQITINGSPFSIPCWTAV